MIIFLTFETIDRRGNLTSRLKPEIFNQNVVNVLS